MQRKTFAGIQDRIPTQGRPRREKTHSFDSFWVCAWSYSRRLRIPYPLIRHTKVFDAPLRGALYLWAEKTIAQEAVHETRYQTAFSKESGSVFRWIACRPLVSTPCHGEAISGHRSSAIAVRLSSGAVPGRPLQRTVRPQSQNICGTQRRRHAHAVSKA